MSARAPVTVVGIGQGGCLELCARAMNAISGAQVLVGGRRQLAFFPEFEGEVLVLEKGLMATLQKVAELSEDHNVCVLASGDPLFYGVGKLIAKKVGPQHVEVIASPSSVQLAFAQVKLNWEDAAFVSVHGRSLSGLCAKLRGEHKVAILTDPEHSPQRIAQHLLDYGQQDWRAHVCSDLGGADQSVEHFESLQALAQREQDTALNVLLLMRETSIARAEPIIGAFEEEAFAKKMPKKGLITKREVRVMALGLLGLGKHSVVWDIGAGSGSVAIEAARLASHGKVFAVETEAEGVRHCEDNLRRFGADNVQVIHSRAPEGLEELPDPDAVFVGGSKGNMEAILELCLARLRPGGKLVVSAITLENVSLAYASFRRLGYVPQLSLLQVSRGASLARYLRYEALNPIHLFSVQKRQEEPAA